MPSDPLGRYGWGPRWEALLADVDGGGEPGRVVRHDGTALVVASATGTGARPLAGRLEPEPVVGDWVVLRDGHPVAVLPRSSLLRRRAASADAEQALVANLDTVLIVCGLDRPVKPGRIQRAASLAWDAGAVPAVVLTKAALVDDLGPAVAAVEQASPGLDVVVTSVQEGVGVDELRSAIADGTATLLGESGAGKSSIVNVLLGVEAAATGVVRAGDAKGRHTTTSRQLHLLPDRGVLVDTPGIREIGLWIDADAVTEVFPEIDELEGGCRFADCRHDQEPGCAVTAAVASGAVAAGRFESWQALRREAESAELRATPHEQRRRDRRFGRIVKQAQRRKGRG